MVRPVTPSIPTLSREISDRELKAKKIQVKALKPTTTHKKTKAQKKIAWISQHFKEFSANTALHGYNHIVRNESTKCER